MDKRVWPVLVLLAAAACSGPGPTSQPSPQPQPGGAVPAPGSGPGNPGPGQQPPMAERRDSSGPKQRVAPPRVAAQLGLMPLASTGMSGFRIAHPTFDGRGVLIAVLDGGVDAGIDGLRLTSTGAPKILDLRDFSGEGQIALHQEGGKWTGELRELPWGAAPQADFNANGNNLDVYRIEVERDSLGWVARIDLDADGSFVDETWMHDFLVRRETFTFSSSRAARGRGPITGALNLSEENGQPRLSVYLDTSGHGSHVSGIASGYNIYQVPGFTGVAPGAQILGLKIADNGRGSVSTTGSMTRAMEYAARFARERNMPLVLNLSFGVGNANEGRATMDSIVNAFLIAHPDAFFAIAAGNDGPGTSTLGLPGSAELAASVGATYPGSFAAVQFNRPAESMGWWSSRGGEVNKPDILAPGVAYSTVPGWNTGDEIKGGTSMATPYVSGLAAVLISAGLQDQQRRYPGATILQALKATARPFTDLPWIDEGPGIAQIEAAWEWLRANHETPRYRVQAMGGAGTLPAGMMPSGGARSSGVAPASQPSGAMAAYRRTGLASRGDTIQRFRVSFIPDSGVSRRTRSYRLVSGAAWQHPAQASVTIDSTTGSAVIEVRYDAAALTRPGRYSGGVVAIATDDSLSGPAFVLASTVIVPDSQRIAVRRATVRSGQVDRYFITVPPTASGLAVRLAAQESAMVGSLSLYEPTGRPARGAKSEDFGGDDPRTRNIVISANDIVPGVWEIAVQAMPGLSVVYSLDARVQPVRLPGPASIAGGSVSAESAGDTALVAIAFPVGADTAWTQTIGDSVERRTFTIPDWADSVFVEVEVTPEVWDQLTDFAISTYAPDGNRIGNGAMNYPFHRVPTALPKNREAGYALTVELFPAFARTQATPFQASVRVILQAAAQPPGDSLTGSFTVRTIPLPPSSLAIPDGWNRVSKVSVGASSTDPFATTKRVDAH